MNMDKINLNTLLEAAKFVELQDVHDQGSYTRDEYGTTVPNIKTEPIATSLRTSPHLEKRAYHCSTWARATADLPYSRAESGDDDLQEARRRPGYVSSTTEFFSADTLKAGTREVHNKLEKNRRAHLKECFELVKKQLPPNLDDKKASNLNILHNAIKYIQMLRRKEREYEHEMERLAREKIALQQRHATLKKELSAQWDHIDFNALIPETIVSEHGELDCVVEEVSDSEELIQRKNTNHYSSASSLSSAATASATASASPHLPHPAGDDRNSPRSQVVSPKHIPSDGPKLISFTSRLETSKRASGSSKAGPPHLQLPVLTSTSSGHIAATLVSPTIQLVASPNIRMIPGDQPLTLSLSHNSPHQTAGVTLMHKSGDGETLSLVHGNGIRGKTQSISLAIPNGALPAGLTAKNGAIYKQSNQSSGGGSLIPAHLASGITHVVTPIAGSHGTLVTPVPVTVVSQGNHQVAHFITAPPGKVVTPLNIKPLMSQYIVKPGAAMVVVSQNSQVTHNSSK